MLPSPSRAALITLSKHEGRSKPDSWLRKGILGLECDLCMEQICSFQRLAVILMLNISKKTPNEVIQRSFCIPTVLKLYDCWRKTNPIAKFSVIHNGIPPSLSSFLLVFSLCPCLPPPLSVILTSSSQNCSLADSSLALPLGSCQHLLIKS